MTLIINCVRNVFYLNHQFCWLCRLLSKGKTRNWFRFHLFVVVSRKKVGLNAFSCDNHFDEPRRFDACLWPSGFIVDCEVLFGIIWQQIWVAALANCFDLVLTIPALLMSHDFITTNGSRSLGRQLKYQRSNVAWAAILLGYQFHRSFWCNGARFLCGSGHWRTVTLFTVLIYWYPPPPPSFLFFYFPLAC